MQFKPLNPNLLYAEVMKIFGILNPKRHYYIRQIFQINIFKALSGLHGRNDAACVRSFNVSYIDTTQSCLHHCVRKYDLRQ